MRIIIHSEYGIVEVDEAECLGPERWHVRGTVSGKWSCLGIGCTLEDALEDLRENVENGEEP